MMGRKKTTSQTLIYQINYNTQSQLRTTYLTNGREGTRRSSLETAVVPRPSDHEVGVESLAGQKEVIIQI